MWQGKIPAPFKEYIEQNCTGSAEKRAPMNMENGLPNAEGVVSLVPDIRKLKEAAGFAQEISL